MRYITCLIFLFSCNLQADVSGKDIDKVCLKHAISLVNRLHSDAMTGLDEIQSRKIREITLENCKQQFHNSENNKSVAPGNDAASEKQADEEDWFTEKVFSGDTTRKEGNKRLDKMRRK